MPGVGSELKGPPVLQAVWCPVSVSVCVVGWEGRRGQGLWFVVLGPAKVLSGME